MAYYIKLLTNVPGKAGDDGPLHHVGDWDVSQLQAAAWSSFGCGGHLESKSAHEEICFSFFLFVTLSFI